MLSLFDPIFFVFLCACPFVMYYIEKLKYKISIKDGEIVDQINQVDGFVKYLLKFSSALSYFYLGVLSLWVFVFCIKPDVDRDIVKLIDSVSAVYLISGRDFEVDYSRDKISLKPKGGGEDSIAEKIKTINSHINSRDINRKILADYYLSDLGEFAPGILDNIASQYKDLNIRYENGRFVQSKDSKVVVAREKLDSIINDAVVEFDGKYSKNEKDKGKIKRKIEMLVIDEFYNRSKREFYWSAYQSIKSVASLFLLVLIEYFCMYRMLIEYDYASSPVLKGKGKVASYYLVRLQQSLDRSILRYNVLGIVFLFLTLTVVMVSGLYVFSLFSSTITYVSAFHEAEGSVSVIILYIMRTSLLAAFVTTTIFAFYRLSKSAFDQAVRFLKRKHATKFLRYIIKKAEETISEKGKYNFDRTYIDGFCPNVGKFLKNRGLLGTFSNSCGIEMLFDLPLFLQEVNDTRRLLMLPELKQASITPEHFKKYAISEGSVIPKNEEDIDIKSLFYTFVNLKTLQDAYVNDFRPDDLEKFMKAFEIWNTDISSAFGEQRSGGKKSSENMLNLTVLKKDA